MSKDPVFRTESRWSLAAVLFGAIGIVVGTAAQVVSKDSALRPVWIGLIIAGAVLAVPAMVLQSPWWRERWRTGQERLQRRRADERHFATSGRGVLRPDWSGSYFTGRTQALRVLADFVEDSGVHGRVRVVVGQPGCGKSAVLGRLTMLADPARRRIDGAIHARGKDVSQIVRAMAECAEVAGAWIDPDRPSVELVDELLLALRNRQQPVTVVVDALDEAVEPERVMREVIRPLVDGDPDTGIRLVLGLRRQLLHLLDVPAGAIVDLDDAAYFDRADMVEYALRCLGAGDDPHVDSPYRSDVARARQVAAAIADQAGQVFLIAQLTARALTRDAQVVDLSAPTWRTSLPSRVGTAMDALLARLPDRARVHDLLLPLAFAEGSGLPPGPLWASLAGALGTSVRTEQDVRWLLGSTPAVDLLQRIETGDGDTRYRLFHEALAEHLRERAAPLVPHDAIARALLDSVPRSAAGHRDWRSAHPYVKAHLATHAARAGHLDELLGDPDFLLAAEPDPLLRSLPGVRDLTTRRAVAIYRGVVHQLRSCTAGEAAAQLELHARQQGLHDLADRIAGTNDDRPWWASWVRARPVYPHQVVGRHDGDVNTVVVASIDGRLRVASGAAAGDVGIWDLEHGTRLGEPITAPAGEVNAVAVGRSPAGPTVVAFGGDQGLWVAKIDGTVQRRLGTQTGIRCVALAESSGSVMVIAGDVDGRIGVYDVVTGACRRTPFDAHPDGVQVLAVAEMDGLSVVASAGIDGSVAVWKLISDSEAASVPAVAAGPVAAVGSAADVIPSAVGSGAAVIAAVAVVPAAATEAVATMTLSTPDGGPATLTVGGLDGVVRTWDLTTGRTLRTRVLGYEGWLNCLTLADFAGRPAVVGGAMDGRALVWRGETDVTPDPAASEAAVDAVLAGHDGWISTVAAVEHDGRDLVVTGGLDGTVRTWNLADAGLLADHGDAHDGEVTTVSLLALGDEGTVAVSGGTDGTVRRWRLADGAPLADPILAHDHGVRVVATSGSADRPTIASGGNDGTVRLWDAVTGQPIGDAIAAHARTVRALAILSAAGRQMLVTGGDGGVRRWDAVVGARIGPALGAEQEIRAITVAVAAGHPVIVAGGDGGLYRWHLVTGEPIGPVIAAGERVNAVAVAKVNGSAVVLAGTERLGLRCWDLATGAPLDGRPPAEYPIRSVAVPEAGDQQVAAAGDDHGVTLHPMRGLRAAQRIRLGFRATAIAAVTPSHVVVGSSQGLYSLHVAEGV